MKTTHIYSRVLICMAAIFALAACGGKKNKADGAKITIVPEKPIVITADVTIDGEDVKAPWFDFAVNIANNTEYPFEIVALQADITGVDSTGQLTTSTKAWSPGELNYSTLVLQCNYSSFGTWYPGESHRLQIIGGSGCLSANVKFPADSNPTGNYRYKVKAKPLGYFIDDSGNPSDRFDKIKMFFTQ